jgi:soluble P-type ATPase
MIRIEVPGGESLILKNLVLDYNGTIAKDGKLLPGLSGLLTELAKDIQIHVITADTFGTVGRELVDIPCKQALLTESLQDRAKLAYINGLEPSHTAAIGNGRNDSLMLKAAALGIAVIQDEGAWRGTILAADVVCNSIIAAIELLKFPLRLKATLRV